MCTRWEHKVGKASWAERLPGREAKRYKAERGCISSRPSPLWGVTVPLPELCCSVSQSYPTLCNPMDFSTPGFPALHHLPELAQTHVHWVGDAIQSSHPLSSPYLPAFNLSQNQGNLFVCLFFRVFSNELALCIRWPKYWSLSVSISSSNEYSGLISFIIDWFDLLAVQGTLKSLLQHHSLKALILPRFNPWVRKIPWRREWQTALVFLPGESHGQRILVGYSPWDCKELDMTEWLTHVCYSK